MKSRVRVVDRGPGGVKRWLATDSFTVDASARTMTPEGFMIVPGKISRPGIQEYGARELGLEGTDKTIRLYRPPEEVFSDAAMASFEGVPITSGHPEGDVNANNFRSVASGFACDVCKAADSKTCDAQLKFMAADAIDRVIGGQDQLSCGYSFRLDMTAGVSPEGEAYDGVMRDIIGNHVAHVWNARGGPGLRVADENNSNRKQEPPMRVIVIDGISIKVEDDTQASIIERAVKTATDAVAAANAARDAAVNETTAAKAALSAATEAGTAAKTAHDAKVAELEAKVVTDAQVDALVEDKINAVTGAKAIVGDKFDGKGKPVAAIRVEALEHVAKDAAVYPGVMAVLGGLKPSEAKPEIAKLAFDAAVAVRAAGGTGGQGRSGANDAAARALAPGAGGGSSSAAGGTARVIDCSKSETPGLGVKKQGGQSASA